MNYIVDEIQYKIKINHNHALCPMVLTKELTIKYSL